MVAFAESSSHNSMEQRSGPGTNQQTPLMFTRVDPLALLGRSASSVSVSMLSVVPGWSKSDTDQTLWD
jgi:hypothetical protein